MIGEASLFLGALMIGEASRSAFIAFFSFLALNPSSRSSRTFIASVAAAFLAHAALEASISEYFSSELMPICLSSTPVL